MTLNFTNTLTNITFYLLLITICFSCKTQTNEVTKELFTLQEGDLLFQDSDCGPFCTAIEKVTFGYKGSKFSHIGLLVKEKNKLKVLEAISVGVVLTPIDTFINRSFDKDKNPKVVVGRLKNPQQKLIPKAINFIRKQMKKPYDDVFVIDNDKYYCSELIYDGFKFANKGNPIFELQPMTFVDPDTKKTFPIWEDYYKDLKVSIPEGEPGLNPGGMSTSLYVDIVHFYGLPTGYVK